MKVFIPLGTGSKQNNFELRHLLRSIERFDAEITVYCTEKPSWLTGVNCVEFERTYPCSLLEQYGTRKYENYFDVLNKIYAYCTTHDGDFLYVTDDTLFLTDKFDCENIALCEEPKTAYKHRDGDRFGRTINVAVDLLKKDVVYNYQTHMPRLLNCEKLRALFEAHPIERDIPYSLFTLYYNLYYEKPKDIIVDNNIYCAYFFFTGSMSSESRTFDQIEKAIENKMFINYDDFGLDKRFKSVLKEWIEQKFPNKSKYEL
jgi:hypothetical protein